MKILIIGGTGTIGTAVVKLLKLRHTLVVAAHTHGDIQVDVNSLESIKKMYQSVGNIDAVVSVTGRVHFGPLNEMTGDAYAIGIKSKLMGQVNLVLAGLDYVNEHGSFTLTSGILNRDPVRLGSSAAMVNGAVDGFVISAALEMPRNIRINAVSPTVLAESMKDYAEYFRGFIPVPAATVAQAYSKSVEGAQTGCVYAVGGA